MNDESVPLRTPPDPYAPAEIALRVEAGGVAKAAMPAFQTLTLALLGGAFIAFGAMFYTVAITGSTLGFGPTRLIGGVAFALGLILVIVAGAELFTGNSLLVMSWVDGRISFGQLLRNWGIVYAGNLLGAVATAAMVAWSGTLGLAGGEVGSTAAGIAGAKLALGADVAFIRGILCNVLVCLAVWLCYAARSVSDKVLAILFPIAAFVALGFEHSVANMYLVPLAFFSGGLAADWGGFARSLAIVTAGNVIGGGVFVALTYWICYRRTGRPEN